MEQTTSMSLNIGCILSRQLDSISSDDFLCFEVLYNNISQSECVDIDRMLTVV